MESISNPTLTNLGIALITAVLGPLAILVFRYYFFKKRTLTALKREEFNSTVKNHNTINNLLNALQEQHKLDRILICQFHNGGNFWPGNQSMKKMSATFESTAPGISTDLMKMQSVPVSFFSGVLETMLENDAISTLSIDNIKDNALRYFWESRGVELVYVFPIYCLDHLLVGVLMIEQIGSSQPITTEILSKLHDEAKRLSGYIVHVAVNTKHLL